MSDIEIKLEPQDEFNHQPDEASNYNESTVSYTHLTLPTILLV